MIKKSVIFAGIFLLVILGASALSQEKVYETWFIDGDTVNVRNESISARVDDSSLEKTTVVLQFKDSSFILINGSCQTRNNFNYCLAPKTEIGEYVYEKSKYMRKCKLEVFQLTASLSIGRKISKTTILVGDTAKITATIENFGKIKASSVKFTDSFPKDYFGVKDSTCGLSDNTVVWNGEIESEKNKICEYTIEALKPKKFRSEAAANFFNGISDKKTSDIQNIEVPSYYITINVKTDGATEKIGKERIINVLVENKKEESIKPTVSIEFPEGVEIIKYEQSDFEKKENKLIMKGSLEGSEKRNCSITVKSVFFGNRTIKADVKYTFADIEQSYTETVGLKSEDAPLLDIRDNVNGSLRKGTNSVEINVRNPSEFKFKDIEATVATNMGSERIVQKIGELLKNHLQKIATISFEPEAGKEYFYEASLNYKSEQGQKLQTAKKRMLMINTTKEDEKKTSTIVNKAAAKTDWALPTGIAVAIIAMFIAYVLIIKKIRKE